MEIRVEREPMTAAPFELLQCWRYNLIQYRTLAAAVVGDMTFYHNPEAFADLYIGSFDQFCDALFIRAKNSIKQWKENKAVSSEQLKQLEDYCRTLPALMKDQKRPVSERFELINYLRDALTSIELELKYTE